MLEIITNWLLDSSINQLIFSSIFTIIFGFVFMIFPIYIVKTQKPKFIIHTREIVPDYREDFSDVKVRFGRNLIENLYETRIYFWNAGKKSIRNHHLVKATPIELSIPNNIKLYSIDFVATRELGKSLEFTGAGLSYQIAFDAMQKDDGVFLRVLHSKTASETIKLSGKLDNSIKLKEIGTFKKYDKKTISFLSIFSNKFTRMILPTFLALGTLFIVFYSYFNKEYLETTLTFIPTQGRVGSMYEVVLMLGICIFMLCLHSIYSFYTELPDELILLSNDIVSYNNLYNLKLQSSKKTKQANTESTVI